MSASRLFGGRMHWMALTYMTGCVDGLVMLSSSGVVDVAIRGCGGKAKGASEAGKTSETGEVGEAGETGEAP